MITLVHKENNEPIITFKETNEPIFHDKLLGRELFEFGIEIIPPDSRKFYDHKAFVFPAQNNTEAHAMALFRRAFTQVYCPHNSMRTSQLKWKKG